MYTVYTVVLALLNDMKSCTISYRVVILFLSPSLHSDF